MIFLKERVISSCVLSKVNGVGLIVSVLDISEPLFSDQCEVTKGC